MAKLLFGLQDLLAHRANGHPEFLRGQGKRSAPACNFNGAQAIEVNLIEVFHIVFLQSIAAKLHTKFGAGVSDRYRKESSHDLQKVHIVVYERAPRQ